MKIFDSIDKQGFLWAIFLTIITLAGAYLYNVLNFPLKPENELTQIVRDWKQEKRTINGKYVIDLSKKDTLFNRYLIVNTAYDVMLVDVTRNGIYMGQQPISDRHKILALLDSAAYYNNYSSIFIDLDFDSTLTPLPYNNKYADSAMLVVYERQKELQQLNRQLVDRICSMRDVYVAIDFDPIGDQPIPLIDSRLDSIAGSVHYPLTAFSNNYSGSSLMLNGRKIAPLMMAEKRIGKQFKHWGPFYFFGSRPCFNNIFPNRYVDDQDVFAINTIGSIITDTYGLSSYFDNRVIVVGNLETDMHQVGLKNRPGTLILLDTYYALLNEEHLIQWYVFLEIPFLFVCFFFIIFRNDKYRLFHPKRPWGVAFVKLIRVSVNFPFMLLMLKIVGLLFFDINFNITMPIFMLSLSQLWREVVPTKTKII